MTQDALLLIKAYLPGLLINLFRVPQINELFLIQSGYVFLYEESTSGIKGWVDGIYWVPIHQGNNFCVSYIANIDDFMKNELTIRVCSANHYLMGYFKLGEAMDRTLRIPLQTSFL